MKKILIILLVLFTISCSQVYANDNLTVQIPSFRITINDNVFDNEHAKYPFFVYNDITYVPLTYSLCREMGVITGWESEKGLYLSKYNDYSFLYKPDLGGSYKKGAKYTASIPSFPVYLNGKNLRSESKKIQYPVLNYKDITYIPLTWEIVYYEFGWDISWDNINGLNINTQNSYSESSYLNLSEITTDYAFFNSRKKIYQQETDENGNIYYVNTGKTEIKGYKLNFATNELTYIGLKDEAKYYEEDFGKSVKCKEDMFTVSDGRLRKNTILNY